MSPKNFGSEKIFTFKNFWFRIIGPTKSWVPKNVCPKNFGFNNILCQKKMLCQKNLGKGVYPYVFGHSKQLSLNKFFDPSTPSMRKGCNGREKNGEKNRKKIMIIVATPSLPAVMLQQSLPKQLIRRSCRNTLLEFLQYGWSNMISVYNLNLSYCGRVRPDKTPPLYISSI